MLDSAEERGQWIPCEHKTFHPRCQVAQLRVTLVRGSIPVIVGIPCPGSGGGAIALSFFLRDH